MKRIVVVAALVCSAVGGHAASAAAPAEFRIGGVVLKFTLPPGYCAPQRKYIDIAQLVTASDNQNVTDLTAYKCDGGVMTAKDPLLIKTPKSVLMTDVERPELLKQMGAVFDNPAFSTAIATGSIDSDSAKSISEVLGQSVTVKTTIKPIGKDDTCAYLAGTVAIGPGAGDGEPEASAVTGCITAVNKRILIVYVYGSYSGPQSIIALAPKAKALALQLIAENQ